MARIDSFLAQLMAYEAEALLIESGDNLYLVKGEQRLPLMHVPAGAIQNAHVVTLLGEVAPPEICRRLEAGEGAEWVYPWGSCSIACAVTVEDGRMRAHLRDASAFTASAAAPAPLRAAPDEAADGVWQGPAVERYLRAALRTGSADLHLTAGRVPMCRVDGEMVALPDFAPLEPYSLQKMIEEIVPDRAKTDLDATHDVDFSWEIDCARVRCNVFRDCTGVGAVLRAFPLRAMTVAELGAPAPLVAMCAQRHGLIVVTGPSGSGKSTTAAALIDWINDNRADHIVTVEEPVEIVHVPKRALVNQRQVREHTGSFARALRAAQREDPDVVFVSDVHDVETLATVLDMAERHLVIVVMHTRSAAAALERIVDRFSPDQQHHARNVLAECLVGVVAQTLCKKIGGGRAAAFEVLEGGGATATLIRERRTSELPRTLDATLRALVDAGVIDAREAVARAVDQRAFQQLKAVA